MCLRMLQAIISDASNGVQVLRHGPAVGRSEYGAWLNLSVGNDGKVDTSNADCPVNNRLQTGYMDDGFDPTSIIVVGVKIGAGGRFKRRPTAGTVYVDGVIW